MDAFRHEQARALGITPAQLRGARFAHPVDGVAMDARTQHDLVPRCRAVALRFGPQDVFTHLTSAALRGWWLPRTDLDLLIGCTNGDAPHLERRGVYLRRCAIPPEHRTRYRGVPVASAAWTIIELAEHLSFFDLVIAIDSALQFGHVTEDQIRATMRPGRRGVRTLRRALTYVDGRSESPGESSLRLVYVLAGVPVEVQPELRNDIGEVIWRLDLRIRGTRYAPEYDGGAHRSPEVHRRDLRRDRLLARWGVERWGYTLPDVVSGFEEIVGDAVRVLGWPVSRCPTDLLRDELGASALTAAGRRALTERLRRFVRTEPPRSVRRTG
ncbi:hypothetical protein D9V41_04000 [Aeromicrobium phragmitis]|uniref:DUF559 domain-containing protein n=1 Tax=Aeromicrobium phragmitis TaxID=2478914 RepID=A0A3L8PR51_9ACTN|nr:hypothetical protein [Aeromicrobium phragmitis]RLV56938.1 hypothetical protein D9V41_04000 [Aeromicrobium phragmitis]